MPENESADEEELSGLASRVRELESKRDALQAQVGALADASSNRWLGDESESSYIRAMKNSISWRITKPLRIFRRFVRHSFGDNAENRTR